MPYLIRQVKATGGKSRLTLKVTYFDGTQWQPWGTALLPFPTVDAAVSMAQKNGWQLVEVNPLPSWQWQSQQSRIAIMWISPLALEKCLQPMSSGNSPN